MLALHPRVVDVVWEVVAPLLSSRPPAWHPLGCHRRRIPDRLCFEAILFRLVTGCSWDVAGRLGRGSETTLRSRRDEWAAAGVFDRMAAEAIEAYDRRIGLDLGDVTIDASVHKAPTGGPGTGPNPTDRGKLVWKWSLATDADGIPLGWVADAANRHDEPTSRPHLRCDHRRRMGRRDRHPAPRPRLRLPGLPGLMPTTGSPVWPVAARRPKGQGTPKQPIALGKRWAAERTNSWLSNYGQLRRNTDRHPEHRLAQFAFAVSVILIIKLIGHADRQHPLAPRLSVGRHPLPGVLFFSPGGDGGEARRAEGEACRPDPATG